MDPKHTEDISRNTDQSTGVETIIETWPRFLIIQSKDKTKPVGKLNPFVSGKAIRGILGTPKNVTCLSSGDLLVEVSRKTQSDTLLSIQSFVDKPVEVVPHRTLNTSKGVVRTKHFDEMAEEELAENLKDQGVVSVKRVLVKRNGTLMKTGTYILDFCLANPPEHVYAEWLRLEVQPYVPNPLRCFTCQRFGHHKSKCRKSSVCVNCGQEGHNKETCQNEPKCVNCTGPHSAMDKNCPSWKTEKEIQTVKIKQNVSFSEARKIVLSRNPTNAKPSYSSILVSNSSQKCTCTCGCHKNSNRIDNRNETNTDKRTPIVNTSEGSGSAPNDPKPSQGSGSAPNDPKPSQGAGAALNDPKTANSPLGQSTQEDIVSPKSQGPAQDDPSPHKTPKAKPRPSGEPYGEKTTLGKGTLAKETTDNSKSPKKVQPKPSAHGKKASSPSKTKGGKKGNQNPLGKAGDIFLELKQNKPESKLQMVEKASYSNVAKPKHLTPINTSNRFEGLDSGIEEKTTSPNASPEPTNPAKKPRHTKTPPPILPQQIDKVTSKPVKLQRKLSS